MDLQAVRIESSSAVLARHAVVHGRLKSGLVDVVEVVRPTPTPTAYTRTIASK